MREVYEYEETPESYEDEFTRADQERERRWDIDQALKERLNNN